MASAFCTRSIFKRQVVNSLIALVADFRIVLVVEHDRAGGVALRRVQHLAWKSPSVREVNSLRLLTERIRSGYIGKLATG